MSHLIYDQIVNRIANGEKLLALLIDPDKTSINELGNIIKRIENTSSSFILVGGSYVNPGTVDPFVKKLKSLTKLPIILFPGDHTQLSHHADALLFLSLLSGRNPQFLIEEHIRSVPFLKSSKLEIIPTGYLLIDGGSETDVLKKSNTKPLDPLNIDLIVNTAMAGVYKGKKIIYLEAGSGAKHPIDREIIKQVCDEIQIPVIVGGGIRTKKQIEMAFEAGAALVVIGTAFENNIIDLS